VSRDSRRASSSFRSKIMSPIRRKTVIRSWVVIFFHGPFNAFLAAATARSISSFPPSATVPSTSSVAGLMLTKVFPLADSTYFPSIQCRQFIVFFSTDVGMLFPPNPIKIRPQPFPLPRSVGGYGWRRSLPPGNSEQYPSPGRKNAPPDPPVPLPFPFRSENPSPPSLRRDGDSPTHG